MTKIKTTVLCVVTAVVTLFAVYSWDNHTKVDPKVFGINISGPVSANPGDLIEYTADAVNKSFWLSKIVYQWKVLEQDKVVPFRQLSEGDILFPAGMNPGKYWILNSATAYYNYYVWSAVAPLGVSINQTVVGTPTPSPTPPVPPTPVPIPVVNDKLYAVAIFDNTNITTLTSGQLSIHNSTTATAALAPLNTVWRNYDKSDPALAGPSWQSIIGKLGVPCLVIADANGKSYFNGTLPASETDVISVVKKLRGQ